MRLQGRNKWLETICSIVGEIALFVKATTAETLLSLNTRKVNKFDEKQGEVKDGTTFCWFIAVSWSWQHILG